MKKGMASNLRKRRMADEAGDEIEEEEEIFCECPISVDLEFGDRKENISEIGERRENSERAMEGEGRGGGGEGEERRERSGRGKEEGESEGDEKGSQEVGDVREEEIVMDVSGEKGVREREGVRVVEGVREGEGVGKGEGVREGEEGVRVVEEGVREGEEGMKHEKDAVGERGEGREGGREGEVEGSDPSRPVRVYADGIYDLFHFGHARALEQAKKLFPNTYLLVGCCSDALTHRLKGKTVMNERERYESLRHCRWVDEVIEDAPWIVTQEFLDKHRIDYVAHDGLPYADTSGGGTDVYEFVKRAGRFKETRRTEGVSTSDLIMRVLRDYNQYVARNLARGHSRKELGLSYVMEKQLYVNMGIQKLQKQMEESVRQNRAYLDRNMKAVTQNLMKAMHTDWMKNADSTMRGFMTNFDAGYHYVEKAIQSQIRKGIVPKKPHQKVARLRSSSIPRSLQIAAPSPSPTWREGEGEGKGVGGSGSGQRPPVAASTALEEVIAAT